ncbi:MAG: T9SS type A sorting domain-containing protein [Sphingomonadales bacterium]|nr:T9SS type A sorting domain-containing protein [Sphingomonadales bacterium]
MKKLHVLFFTLLWLTTTAQPQLVVAQSFDPILASRLQNKIDSFRTANNLKGISAGVFYPGMGTWKGVTGISHTGTPMTSDLLFGIASNTKLFTGVLLLKLAENNIVHLNDSLRQYLPAFNHVDSNITIRQLLNHTSGLYDVTSVPGYSDSMLANPNRVFTASELLTWAGPPLFQTGTGWSYCNTNYLLAALVAESATGRSYSQLLRDSILTPLQLDSTFLDVYESILYPIAHPWQGGMNFNSTPRTSINSAAWSAGAMYSTSGEMLQWYRALMSGMVLNAQSMNELTTFVGSGNYGIGISRVTVLGRTVWTHGGLIWGGYNSSMMYDPATGIVICVLINQLPAQANQASIQLLSTLLSNPLAINENSTPEKLITVYPNPTNGRAQLEIQNQTILDVKVYDLKGMLVKVTTDSQLDLSNYPSGLYFIRAQTANGYYSGKLIKQ